MLFSCTCWYLELGGCYFESFPIVVFILDPFLAVFFSLDPFPMLFIPDPFLIGLLSNTLLFIFDHFPVVPSL